MPPSSGRVTPVRRPTARAGDADSGMALARAVEVECDESSADSRTGPAPGAAGDQFSGVEARRDTSIAGAPGPLGEVADRTGTFARRIQIARAQTSHSPVPSPRQSHCGARLIGGGSFLAMAGPLWGILTEHTLDIQTYLAGTWVLEPPNLAGVGTSR